MHRTNKKEIETQSQSPLSVLVVEDDEGLNRLVCKQLEKSGFVVHGVYLGVEAMAFARQNPETLMLLDLQLPDMSGIDVIDELTNEGNIVPFIVMTGYGDERVAVSMMKKGAEDYLVKDSTFLDLISVVTTRVSKSINRDKKLAATQKALLTAAQHWETTFDTISDAVCLLTLDSTILRCNRAMREMLGKSQIDIIGTTCCQLLHEHSGPIEDCPYQRAIKNKRKETKILSVEDQFLEIVVFPILDDEANVSGAVHIVRDITDKREKEVKLQDSINNLNEAVRGGRIGLWNWDLKKNKVTFSTEWKGQIGYKGHEISDDFSEWEKRIHPDDLQSAIATVEKSVQDINQEHRSEFRLRHKDGSYRWILAQASLILDKDGQPIKMLGSHIDITDRKKVEYSLRKSEVKYRSMIESMSDAVYIASPDLIVEYMNPKMIERLGEDATGEPCYKALQGLDHQCDHCIFDKVSNGQTIGTNIVSPLDDRHYRITNMPIYNPSGTISKMSIYRDITEYVKAVSEKENAERQLIQAQKMESIGTLAGGIAHDFNNILSAVLGYAELALADVEKATPIEEDLQEIYSAGIRAKELVNQILTFAHQSDEERKPIQVNSIIKEVLKFIRSSIPTTIEIKQNLASNSLIMGNSTQIHQIMMNLCTNAAHAMENEGGTLGITLKNITIDRTTNLKGLKSKLGNYIELKVSDTGTGMEPHIIEKIFEPYFTTKKPGEGTGMGLAMVHGIVETYGGDVIVESTPGKGTVFTICFPNEKQKSVPLPVRSNELPAGQERILLVDDEAPLIKILCRILGQLGYSVTTNTSSLNALDIFSSRPNDFDLIISDVTMPEMTGDQLAKRILQIRPDIPIILCTGYSKRLSEETASEIGIRAIASKPIVKEDLAKIVRDVLDLAKDSSVHKLRGIPST